MPSATALRRACAFPAAPSSSRSLSPLSPNSAASRDPLSPPNTAPPPVTSPPRHARSKPDARPPSQTAPPPETPSPPPKEPPPPGHLPPASPPPHARSTSDVSLPPQIAPRSESLSSPPKAAPPAGPSPLQAAALSEVVPGREALPLRGELVSRPAAEASLVSCPNGWVGRRTGLGSAAGGASSARRRVSAIAVSGVVLRTRVRVGGGREVARRRTQFWGYRCGVVSPTCEGVGRRGPSGFRKRGNGHAQHAGTGVGSDHQAQLGDVEAV